MFLKYQSVGTITWLSHRCNRLERTINLGAKVGGVPRRIVGQPRSFHDSVTSCRKHPIALPIQPRPLRVDRYSTSPSQIVWQVRLAFEAPQRVGRDQGTGHKYWQITPEPSADSDRISRARFSTTYSSKKSASIFFTSYVEAGDTPTLCSNMNCASCLAINQHDLRFDLRHE